MKLFRFAAGKFAQMSVNDRENEVESTVSKTKHSPNNSPSAFVEREVQLRPENEKLAAELIKKRSEHQHELMFHPDYHGKVIVHGRAATIDLMKKLSEKYTSMVFLIQSKNGEVEMTCYPQTSLRMPLREGHYQHVINEFLLKELAKTSGLPEKVPTFEEISAYAKAYDEGFHARRRDEPREMSFGPFGPWGPPWR